MKTQLHPTLDPIALAVGVGATVLLVCAFSAPVTLMVFSKQEWAWWWVSTASLATIVTMVFAVIYNAAHRG